MNDNILKGFMERMQKLFEIELEKSGGHCKSSEPSITFGLSNDGKYWCEIYSYLVDYTIDGGRHHWFESKSFDELVKKVDEAICQQEKELIK